MVPEGWEVKRLDELTLFIKDGTHGTHADVENGIPLLSAKDIDNGNIHLENNPRLISVEDYSQIHKKYTIEKGDVLLTVVGTIGRLAIVQTKKTFTLQRSVAIIRASKTTSNTFLYCAMQSERFFNQLLLRTNASAQGGIYLGELAKCTLPCPQDSAEQQKIATILSTLDRTIEATQKLIDKEKMVKKGLMADLLTHGIDEQGWIRSPQMHTYVDSPLGMIPQGWEVKALGELGEFKNGINKSKEEFGFGVPFVNLQDIFGKWSISSNHFGLVNADENEIKNYNLVSGDVLFVRSSVKASGVGLTALVREDMYSTVYSGFVIRFRSKPNIYATLFKQYCFHEELFRQRLLQKATVSANSNINQESLASLLVSLPSVAEQKRIATILFAQDRKIETEETNLAKLQNLKKGLMMDLLSGDVRVKG